MGATRRALHAQDRVVEVAVELEEPRDLAGACIDLHALAAQRMVDGIASFDDVLARMQAKVTGNAVRSQSGLKHARDTLVLM